VVAISASLLLAILTPCLTRNAQAQNDAARQFKDLLDADWEYGLEQSPVFASLLGDRRWNDQWGHGDLGSIKAREDHTRATLTQLRAIDRSKLSPADQLNYDLFARDTETSLKEYEFRTYLLPVSQRDGIQLDDSLGELLRFQTIKDYEDWIARLNAFPTRMDQTIALMREGMKARMLWPKVVMQRVSGQIDKQVVARPEDSPFYKPFREFPAGIAAADQQRLTAAARAAVSDKLVPAFRTFKQFFDREYLPACFDQVGVWQMPTGATLYAFEARKNTTTDLTPEQIHAKGLSEVARIRAEMQKIMERTGFKGTLPEFFQKLRTDPQFYYKTPQELLDAYRATAKRIDPTLVKVFKTLPRTPYGVTPIPDNQAPDTTTAYYNQPSPDGSRPGYYYVNLYKPETRPKYEMMALSMHESVPGHHLQIALAQELGEIPKFRRYGGYTAFVEGWGLYSESLGDELGLYDDPYAKFGQLTYEMWRAVRLVVDTGMHYFKWDRQKAIDFFRDNAAKTDQDIVNEIDRYISDPGQALAYKVGELKIKELRARATTALGADFDVREFHDVVLLSGALPLDVLERNVDEWIARKRKK
jgi:prolyl oligopeptidase